MRGQAWESGPAKRTRGSEIPTVGESPHPAPPTLPDTEPFPHNSHAPACPGSNESTSILQGFLSRRLGGGSIVDQVFHLQAGVILVATPVAEGNLPQDQCLVPLD